MANEIDNIHLPSFLMWITFQGIFFHQIRTKAQAIHDYITLTTVCRRLQFRLLRIIHVPNYF